MNIVSTQFTLSQRALEIYVSGCNGNCKGCHNPELKDFNLGDSYNEWFTEIKEKINSFQTLIHNIWILGGEPLDQDNYDLQILLQWLKDEFNIPIWLFTRYQVNEVPKNIINLCDYIKCGEYDETKLSDDNIQYGIKLATNNQYIIKRKEFRNNNYKM